MSNYEDVDEPVMAASVIIEEKSRVWIDDGKAVDCFACKKKFEQSYFQMFSSGKHHCRCCGNVFCENCTGKSIKIPSYIVERPKAEDFKNITYYIKSIKSEKERVCDRCYYWIERQIETQKIVDTMMSKSINDVMKLSDTIVKNTYLNHLRSIQSYLPNHVYSTNDRRILMANAGCFATHSKYVMHLIKSINWDYFDRTEKNTEYCNFIFGVINSDQRMECSTLHCTRTCQELLSIDDCINIIYSCNENLPDTLVSYLFELMEPTSVEEIKFLYHHSVFFVYMIKIITVNTFLRNKIYNLIITNENLSMRVIWLLFCNIQKYTDQERENIKIFLELFRENKMIICLRRSYKFFTLFIKNMDDPIKFLDENFDNYKPIVLPFEDMVELIEYDKKSVSIKDSYNRPIMIKFSTKNHGQKRLLFKKECIFNDLIIMDLFSLSEIILRKNLSVDFNVITYNILPINPEFGIVEIVEGAETIQYIQETYRNILQFIVTNNEEYNAATLLDRYMYSMVSYTLHSYFLGLGDRHLENIMINHEGVIFHIDFGFILGKDSYPFSPDMKINANMLDPLFGKNNARYNQYLEYCSCGVIVLRKYFNIYFILLSQLGDQFKEKYVEDFITSRFQPSQSDDVVIEKFLNIMKKSQESYWSSFRDFLHYHNKEKTFNKPFSSVLKKVYDVVSTLIK